MPFLCVIFQSFSCHSALRLSFLQSFLCHSVIALHSSVLCCFQFIGRVLVCVARLWGGEQLKDEGPGIGAGKGGPAGCWSRPVRRGGGGRWPGRGPGLGEPRPGRPVQGRLSENTRICCFFHVLSFPDFFCHFCHFLSCFVISRCFCHFFVVSRLFVSRFVIFCRFFCHLFVISRNLCHFLSLGQSFFSHFPKPLSFLSLGQSFFFQVRNLCHCYVIFVSFPEPLSFCQSFLFSPLPGPGLCQYVRIPGQTIQRPCLLLEG